MLFKDVIAGLLPPIDLGEVETVLNSADAEALDRLQAKAEQLIDEVRPDLALDTLSDWERVYDLQPAASDSVSIRRKRVMAKLAGGGLSRQYFINLASLLGQTITITEYSPSLCGEMVCGDEFTVDGINWMWTVSGLTTSGDYSRCGDMVCGEELGSPSISIETIFNELKPAHTLVNFVYTT